ncbi:hypothetical protein DSECCO2_373930 [anaerobic digester metagenome]
MILSRSQFIRVRDNSASGIISSYGHGAQTGGKLGSNQTGHRYHDAVDGDGREVAGTVWIRHDERPLEKLIIGFRDGSSLKAFLVYQAVTCGNRRRCIQLRHVLFLFFRLSLQRIHRNRLKIPRIQPAQLVHAIDGVTRTILIRPHTATGRTTRSRAGGRLHFLPAQGSFPLAGDRSQEFVDAEHGAVGQHDVRDLDFAQVGEVDDDLAAVVEGEEYRRAFEDRVGLLEGFRQHDVLSGHGLDDYGFACIRSLDYLLGVLRRLSHGTLRPDRDLVVI